MGAYKEEIKLHGGEVHLYIRAGSVKDRWNCSIKLAGKPRIRFSTGHSDEDLAKQMALNRYQAYRASLDGGMSIEKLKWDVLFEKYDKVRPTKSYRRFNKAYFAEYFKRFRDLKVISSADIQDYWNWRINYWLDEDNLKKKAKESKNAMYHISRKPNIRTLKIEGNALQNIFQFARNEGLMNRIPQINVPEKHHNVETMNKRGWFSEAEYKLLINELRKRCNPKRYRSYRAWHKEKGWITRKADFHPHRILCWHRLRYAVLIMSNCGIRPMELVRLRFKDIKQQEMRYKKTDVMIPFTYIDLTEKQSKVNKPREIFFRDSQTQWKRKNDFLALRNKLEKEPVTEDDLIFPLQIRRAHV